MVYFLRTNTMNNRMIAAISSVSSSSSFTTKRQRQRRRRRSLDNSNIISKFSSRIATTITIMMMTMAMATMLFESSSTTVVIGRSFIAATKQKIKTSVVTSTTTSRSTAGLFFVQAFQKRNYVIGRQQQQQQQQYRHHPRHYWKHPILNKMREYPSSIALLSPLFLASFSEEDHHNNITMLVDTPPSAPIPIPTTTTTNQQLVERRLERNRGKRAARKKTIQQRVTRNLTIKRMLHSNASSSSSSSIDDDDDDGSSNTIVPRLYAVKVWVDDDLRQSMKLSGREKRGRVFISKLSNATQTYRGIQDELYSFFSCLRKDTYRITANLPRINPTTGTVHVVVPNEEHDDDDNNNDYATTDDDTGGNSNSTNTIYSSWKIENDGDVVKTFAIADAYYHNLTTTTTNTNATLVKQLQRPSIQINVCKNPDGPVPPPVPPYLQDMANPDEAETMTMLSFYSFPPSPPGIVDVEEFAIQLKKKWKQPFKALGRVYVANEGVNAQMSVPTNVVSNFIECCKAIPELGTYMENGINIDPIPLTIQEFATAGVPINSQPGPPFRNLHIRVRSQIVADGLLPPSQQQQQQQQHTTNSNSSSSSSDNSSSTVSSLDWQSAGYDMPPLEWHERLKELQQASIVSPNNSTVSRKDGEESKDTNIIGTTTNNNNNDNNTLPIVLDCRNTYETDVGIFEGAEPLGTDNFRDSWDVLQQRLADTPKDSPIMTYCTGGIRCVKVGAYLTQEMGFTNVSRLAGGIIAYDRTLNEQKKKKDERDDNENKEGEESMFKGTNFVFDGRLGRQITKDKLGKCLTCDVETSSVSNCRNPSCHKRMIQCETCRTNYHGTCSTACKNRIVNGAKMASHLVVEEGKENEQQQSQHPRYESLDDYSLGHSSPVPSIYKELELNSQMYLTSGSHMVSGAAQGRLLTQFASMTRNGRILELGTFTGYATACLLEGSKAVGEILLEMNNNQQGIIDDDKDSKANNGPYVLSMERDSRAINLAAAHLRIIGNHGFHSQEAVEAMKALRSTNDHGSGCDQGVDEVHDDVVSVSVGGITRCDLLRVTDALATVEAIATGDFDDIPSPVAPFDLVFVDADKSRLLEYVEACLTSNRLLSRGGLIVVDNVLWKGLVLEASTGEFVSVSDDNDTGKAELRKNRRARKLATAMHRFNSAIVADDRAEVLLLQIRDGLSVIRKK